MKAIQCFGGTYGWMARIGIIVPATNTNMEQEFHWFAPEGASVHTTRLLLPAEQSKIPGCGRLLEEH